MLYVRDEYLYKKITIVLLIFSISLLLDINKDEKKEGRYLRREFSYSKFQQTMILPDDVDKEKISAQVENGVLNINLPKFTEQEKEKTKKFIDVK